MVACLPGAGGSDVPPGVAYPKALVVADAVGFVLGCEKAASRSL